MDNGDEFTYTGSGGHDLSGNKRIAPQSCDQELTRNSAAIAWNCKAKLDNKKGGVAGTSGGKVSPSGWSGTTRGRSTANLFLRRDAGKIKLKYWSSFYLCCESDTMDSKGGEVLAPDKNCRLYRLALCPEER